MCVCVSFRNVLCDDHLPTDQQITDAEFRDLFERQDNKGDGKLFMLLIVIH